MVWAVVTPDIDRAREMFHKIEDEHGCAGHRIYMPLPLEEPQCDHRMMNYLMEIMKPLAKDKGRERIEKRQDNRPRIAMYTIFSDGNKVVWIQPGCEHDLVDSGCAYDRVYIDEDNLSEEYIYFKVLPRCTLKCFERDAGRFYF